MGGNVLLILLVSFTALILLIAGVQLWRGKWLFLIADYIKLNDEKRKKLNIRFLGKINGIMTLSIAVILIGMAIWPQLKWVWLISEVLVLGVGLIFLNTSPKRFKKEN